MSIKKIVSSFLLIMSTIVLADPSLQKEFENPSKSFRPYVWWHWMNGFINAEQAKKDLDWFANAGVGGVQVFEAGLGPRAPDDLRIDFGSAEWQSAFENSLVHAESLGLDVAVPTSAGWSATGGPWVKPENAMKKLVWTKQVVDGDELISLQLERPSDIAGMYLDVGTHDEDGLHFYRDIKVLAMPIHPVGHVDMTLLNGELDQQSLNDSLFARAQNLKINEHGEASITLKQDDINQTVHGLTVGSYVSAGLGSPAAPVIKLETSANGLDFKHFVTLGVTDSPDNTPARVACFRPHSSPFWRLTWSKDPRPNFLEGMHQEPGAAPLPFGNSPASYNVSELLWHDRPCINAAPRKAGFDAADDYYALANDPDIEASTSVEQVIDVTDFMDAHGQLTWRAPQGKWLIIRLGYSLTGHKNGPAPASATGLESDKFDPLATREHLDQYFSMLFKGKPLPSSVNGLLSDSIESHEQNWTETFPKEFLNQNGYDITPWLPVLTGEVVESSAASDKFLWDFRQTINTLYDRYYETLAHYARNHGMEFYGEALEDRRPQLGNDLNMRVAADTPMAAFWYYPADKNQKGTYLADLKGAASVANIYGRNKVALEALTSFGFPWAVPPSELKRVADHAMIVGANQFIMHSSIHQWMGKNYSPGQSMMFLLGHYFNRNSTWSDMARAWTDYIARMQVVMRQGYFRAEVAYFMGEEAPLTMLFRDGMPVIPSGIDYDFVSADGLKALSVDEGELRNAKGNIYKAIYLGGSSQYMSLNTLKRIKALVDQGVYLIGDKPLASPSLADDAEQFTLLVDSIWQSKIVIQTDDLEQGLAKLKIKPKWQFSGGDIQVHARRGQYDSYMLRNPTADATQGILSFDNRYACLQKWDALTGNITPLPIDIKQDKTNVFIDLSAFQSVILMSSNETCQGSQKSHFEPMDTQQWSLSFDDRYMKLDPILMRSPEPWSKSEVANVKFYSGVATYQTIIEHDVAEKIQINITAEQVGDMAEVFLNDRSLGFLWAHPAQIQKEVSLKKGQNIISIKVGNVWKNRLVGQANGLEGYSGIPPLYTKEAPLKFSGLSGVNIEIRN